MTDKTYAGNPQGKGRRFALVVSRFNEFVTLSLQTGAETALLRQGVEPADIVVVHVPGAFEIPVAAARLARSGRFDGIVALGAVIRGATAHFDYVCAAAERGCSTVALETGVPVGFGVLTCNTVAEAIERAGADSANKGAEAALAALQMADLFEQLDRVELSSGPFPGGAAASPPTTL